MTPPVLINPVLPANPAAAGNRSTSDSTAGRGFAEQLATAGATSRSKEPAGDIDARAIVDASSEDRQATDEALPPPVSSHALPPRSGTELANIVLADTGLADTGLPGTEPADTELADTTLASTILSNTGPLTGPPLAAQQAGSYRLASGVPFADTPFSDHSLNTAHQRLQLIAEANNRSAMASSASQPLPSPATPDSADPQAMAVDLSSVTPASASPLWQSLPRSLAAGTLTHQKPTHSQSQRIQPPSTEQPLTALASQIATSPLSYSQAYSQAQAQTQAPSTSADTLQQAMISQSMLIEDSGNPGGRGTADDAGAELFGASLAQSSAAARSAATAGLNGTATSISSHIDSPDWPRQLGHSLVRIGIAANHSGGDQRVELRLHPAELGPLSVSLRLGEHAAQAQFVSANPQVRQAVEQALPQLREILSEQGIQLGQTSVSDHGHQASSGDGDSRQDPSSHLATGGPGHPATSVDEGEALLSHRIPLIIDGHVDLYA